MLYRALFRPLLGAFSPEAPMNLLLKLTLFLGRFLPLNPLIRWTHRKRGKRFTREVFGLHFPNPVGLAAGIDRNGEYIDIFSHFGFGFVEIGSLTARPEVGLPRTAPAHPNKGVRNAISNLTLRSERSREETPLPVGVNIAAQAHSLTEAELTGDYRSAFALMYDFADFFVINLTDPVRDLAGGIQSDPDLLSDIVDEILDMRLCYDVYKPVLLKISSGLSSDLLEYIVDYARMAGVDGIVTGSATGKEESDATERTLSAVRFIHERTKGRLPVIAGGGIRTPGDARAALEAGAALVEVGPALYTRGPKIAKKILKHL